MTDQGLLNTTLSLVFICALKYILKKFVTLHTQLCLLNTAELAERGSLFDLLHKEKYQPSQEERLRWAIQIAEGSIIFYNNILVFLLQAMVK